MKSRRNAGSRGLVRVNISSEQFGIANGRRATGYSEEKILWGEDILSRRVPGVHRNRAAFKHRAISRMETQPMIRMKIT